MDVLRRIFERDGADIAGRSSSRSSATPRRSCPSRLPRGDAGAHEEFGSLLIFDEVKTGFRFARGGAAEFFGITPDLATYAKAMGNGYPAAAFGGRAR
jgi:hypothetical protein